MRFFRYPVRKYRYSVILLKELVKTDFKLRYQGSTLGYVWSLLRPLLLFVILYVVFVKFLPVGKGVPHYPVYLLLGIVLWNYFSEVTSGSVGAIVGRGDLIRKINFPKYIIILSVSFSALINLFLNFIVVGIFMVIGHVHIGWEALLLIPLIAELFILSLAAAFLLSTLFVKFRDVSYIWEVIMQAAFYATPIIYALNKVPNHVAKLIILNPMAQIIQDSRYCLVTTKTLTIQDVYKNTMAWAIPIGITLIVSIAGPLYFKKRSKYFAEEV
jgi:ABC-2 type transport system permease protein